MNKVMCLVSLLVVLRLGRRSGNDKSARRRRSQAAREYDTAKGGESVAIGDLNGDGKPDVVSAHGTDFPTKHRKLRAVSVLLNRGGGRLGPSKVYPTGKTGDELGAWSVAIGDLTGDGKPDLATANPGARSVSLLVGRGTRRVRAPRQLPDRPSALGHRDRRHRRGRQAGHCDRESEHRLRPVQPGRRHLRGQGRISHRNEHVGVRGPRPEW